MNNDQDQPQSFATPEEAVKKAKSDLLSLLRSNKDLNVGADAATLERSQPGKSVRRVDLDFEKLLTADSVSSFDALVKSERNTVVPLVADNNVVTIVEVNRDEKGWRVVGLAGKDIADDLSNLRKVLSDSAQYEITLYEVPNLQAKVYGVKRNDSKILFTNYGGRFSIREGVNAASLVPILKADAIEFQRKYGDMVKKQRLVR